MNLLESLKRYTTVVADTGDIDAIAAHKPQDATTNPSLLYQAAQKPQYQHLVEAALRDAAKTSGDQAARAEAFTDALFVGFGREILKHVPGRVSTEVDAGLSFDREGTLAKAKKLMSLYEQAGVGRDRVLIRSTNTMTGWHGVRTSFHWDAPSPVEVSSWPSHYCPTRCGRSFNPCCPRPSPAGFATPVASRSAIAKPSPASSSSSRPASRGKTSPSRWAAGAG